VLRLDLFLFVVKKQKNNSYRTILSVVLGTIRQIRNIRQIRKAPQATTDTN
jgi:hypothetical protein